MSYRAPVKDMLFVMKELAGIEAVAALPGHEDAGYDTAAAVLEESAKFNEGVVAPLNWEGDKNPSFFKDGQVTTTPGFKQAFRQFAEGGWQGLQHPTEFGGQGLPKLIHAACSEMVNSANLSFALCPLLTDGAIEALLTAGTPEQQATYLPKMIDGSWTGSMNLTEPQAGSDLSAVRTRAEPQPDGSYKIFGTKIYITYGEHDMADNIVHLVLARVVGAPEGVKGISLFICPKFMVKADGSLGARNDVHCVSIEHKLGIKASPTAVLQYGDHGGAVGFLIGQENRGLEYMFIMMNAARYGVGVQGIALAERAYQKAVAYARDRVQSRPVDGSLPKAGAIIHHPDVRRMLMTMRAHTEGCRAMALVACSGLRCGPCPPRCRDAQAEPGLLRIPGAADQGPVHRDEPGSGQPGRAGARRHGFHRRNRRGAVPARRQDPEHLRRHHGHPGQRPGGPQDGARRWRRGARPSPAQIEATEGALKARNSAACQTMAQRLGAARRAFEDVVAFVAGQTKAAPNAVFAGSVPYLMMAGTTVAGWQMARALMAAEDALASPAADTDTAFMQAKIATARFYGDHILNKVPAERDSIVEGAESVTALALESF